MGKKMDLLGRVVILLTFLLFSCAPTVNQNVKKELPDIRNTVKEMKIERVGREKVIIPPVLIPTYKSFNPLEKKKITLAAVNAPITKVLYVIAKEAGLNLIIAPDVDTTLTVTAHFDNAPLKYVLDTIMNMTGLSYELKGNVLYVRQFVTKIFKIPYVNIKSDYKSSLGGDVLGSVSSVTSGGSTIGGGAAVGGAGGATQLKGDFSLNFSSEKKDLFDEIENNIKNLLSEDGTYVLNRFTGVLLVRDRKENVEKVEKFLKSIIKTTERQVLIEAKVLEVGLSSGYEYGIDWNLLLRNLFNEGVNVSLSQNLRTQRGTINVNVVAADFNMLIRALSTFGKVYTLSNPRIRVLNGQTALITAGRVVPFFSTTYQAQLVGGQQGQTAVLVPTITQQSILEGILLGVTPYIDEDGEIILNIVPVATRLEDVKSLTDEFGRTLAEAPVVNLKEAGTVVKVREGEMVILGGLINTTNEKKGEGVPLLGKIPLLGSLFRKESSTQEKRELVILLKPVIVD